MSFPAQVLHVFRKDLVRFRLHLLVVVGLALVVPSIERMAIPALSVVLMVAGAGLLPLILAGVAALVVLEDRVAGSDTAFWPTRPVSPVAVLGAKLLFVGLFLVLVPVAVQVLYLQRFGEVDAPALARGALISHGRFMVVAVLVASFTASFRSALGLILLSGLALTFLVQASVVYGEAGGVSLTRSVLVSLGMFVLIPLLLVHHYRVRRTGRAVVGAVGLMVALILGVRGVDANWLRSPLEPEVRFAYPEPEALELRIGSIHHTLSRNDEGEPSLPTMQADLLMGAPERVLVQPRGVRVHLVGEPPLPVTDVDLESHFSRWQPGWPIRAGVPVPTVDTGITLRPWMDAPLMEGSPQELEEWGERTRGVRISTELDLYRQVPVASLPLREGTRALTPLGEFRVTSLEILPTVVRGEVILVHARDLLTQMHDPRSPRFTVLLHNRSRGEVLASSNTGGGSGGRLFTLVGGSWLESWSQRFEMDLLPRTAPPGVEPQAQVPEGWLDGAEIQVSVPEYAGSAARSFFRPIPEWPRYGRMVPVDPRR